MGVQEKAKAFGIQTAKYYLQLKEKKYFDIASQFFRSWTSIGANLAEAQRSPSKKDFIHKLTLALKEAEETKYWLDILQEGFGEEVEDLRASCEELIKILVIIIKNTKKNISP